MLEPLWPYFLDALCSNYSDELPILPCAMTTSQEQPSHQGQIIFASSQLECGSQRGKLTLIKEGYGGEYVKNSISNDYSLLTSVVPTTNRPLAFTTTKSDTFPGQDNKSIDSRNNFTHPHLLRCTARNLTVSVQVDAHMEVIKGFLVSCSPSHGGRGHVPVHEAFVRDYKKG